MISIILYGRNDNYGYNLHKRAAISFNCLAEILTDPDDEILFVDYNTPDDFPSFPEAIHDTLTERARKMLRILRVRSHVHERFRSRTHLVALEPISRNIAARRSNPNNRWLLSTNTDIVMVPQHGEPSLSELVRDLPSGFWQAPRLEIPETLWEGLDRREPAKIIATVREWGRSLHLDEIVLANPQVLYDGPGDFQLIERSALFELDGFHEDMLLGWHVDANIAVRMARHYGAISDLGDRVFAYHCDHTRQVTPAHTHNRKQNSIEHFVDKVSEAGIPSQRGLWGCPQDEIEEVRIDKGTSQSYISALSGALGAPAERPYRSAYASAEYDRVEYDPRHVLPFLADLFSASPRTARTVWWGFRDETLMRFARVWSGAGFLHPIIMDADWRIDVWPPGDAIVERLPAADAYDACDVFIFDFGECYTDERTNAMAAAVARVLAREYAVWDDPARKRRRFVGINCINNRFEMLFCTRIAASATPFSSRLRHGFALPPFCGPADWLPSVTVGRGGERHRDGAVVKRPDIQDWMFYGPYFHLPAGRYRIRLGLEFGDPRPSEDRSETSAQPMAYVDVSSRGVIFALAVLRDGDIATGEYELLCDIPVEATEKFDYAVEVRAAPAAEGPFRITSITVDQVGPAPANFGDVLFGGLDWLPFLRLGVASVWGEAGIASAPGSSGHIAYGPYWRVPAGSYEAELDLEVAAFTDEGPLVTLVAQSQGVYYGFTAWRAERIGAQVIRISVEVDETSAADPEFRLEFPIWTSGEGAITLRGLRISPVPEGGPAVSLRMETLALLKPAGGRTRSGGLSFQVEDYGYFAQATIPLGRGRYRAEARATLQGGSVAAPVAALVVMGGERTLSHALWGAEEFGKAASASFDLAAPAEVQFHLWSTGACGGQLRRFALVRRLDAGEPERDSFVARVEPGSAGLPMAQPEFPGRVDWLPKLQLGPAGVRSGGEVESRAGKADVVFYGPYKHLPFGGYEAQLDLRLIGGEVEGALALLEIVEDREPIVRRALFSEDFAKPLSIPFRLQPNSSHSAVSGKIETRLRSVTGEPMRLASLVVVSNKEAQPQQGLSGSMDWLPFMTPGGRGRWRGRLIESKPGSSDHLAYGPYWRLPPGRYVAEFEMETALITGGCTLEVAFGAEPAAQTVVPQLEIGRHRHTLAFEVTRASRDQDLETRVWLKEGVQTALVSVKVLSINP